MKHLLFSFQVGAYITDLLFTFLFISVGFISSSNAKKWEVELQTLKNNNARLTAALQESTANVEEWKKQLATYKDEGVRLKKKVIHILLMSLSY